jgi:hypothetical protein
MIVYTLTSVIDGAASTTVHTSLDTVERAMRETFDPEGSFDDRTLDGLLALFDGQDEYAVLDRHEILVCVHCLLPLHDDGTVLIDSTGGDACGVPSDTGREHGHCPGFAPDAWGSDPNVCVACFVHRDDHPGTPPLSSTER